MGERTFGQKLGQWITNFKNLIPLLAILTAGTGYGVYPEAKKLFTASNNSPLTTQEITPEVEPINYDRIIKELIDLNKKLVIELSEKQEQINKLKQWHE